MRGIFRPRQNSSVSVSWLALLLLMSDNETNPGPTVKLGCVNAHSIVEKGALIQDMIVAHNFDALAVCETWIVNDDPDAAKLDCAPDGYRVLHQLRPAATRRTRGGGLCVIYRDTLTVKCHPLQQSTHYKTFECQLVSLGLRSNDTVMNHDRRRLMTLYGAVCSCQTCDLRRLIISLFLPS
jgi:hypothetical protein